MASTFGTRIKELRNKQKLTLEQLAQASGSAKSYIWELENKNPPRPSADKLSLIRKRSASQSIIYLVEMSRRSARRRILHFLGNTPGLPDDTKEQL